MLQVEEGAIVKDDGCSYCKNGWRIIHNHYDYPFVPKLRE
jgi:hypothetical protein